MPQNIFKGVGEKAALESTAKTNITVNAATMEFVAAIYMKN